VHPLEIARCFKVLRLVRRRASVLSEVKIRGSHAMDQIFESSFGGGPNSSNGGEIDGYCPNCRADTSHVILESYGDEPRRVQCAVCGNVHSYKKPRGAEDEGEPVTVARRKALKKLDWRAGITSYDRTRALRYSPRTRFDLHAFVVHPTFGVGFVSEVMGDNKVEVIFRDDSARVLVHGRGENDEELRGERVESSELEGLLNLELGPSPEEIAAERERRLEEEEAERRRQAEERRLAAERARAEADERREAERVRREEEREAKRRERDEERKRKEEERVRQREQKEAERLEAKRQRELEAQQKRSASPVRPRSSARSSISSASPKRRSARRSACSRRRRRSASPRRRRSFAS
jgi:hypothetical protein